MKFLAKTFEGLEGILSKELMSLNALNVRQGRRSVFFEGDLKLLYQCNLHLRTAISVLRPVYEFEARGDDELYQKIYDFDWSVFLSVNQTFSITPVIRSSYFKHSKYTSLKVKDAIVDQFRDRLDKRPDVDTRSPDIPIQLHINQEQCSISLDSSGDPLFKRGYRKETGPAPLNEVMAAGLILLSGWNPSLPFIDPMCGSGTLPIEAAMIALNIPPAYLRKSFAFQNWPDFDLNTWNELQIKIPVSFTDSKIDIRGYDSSQNAVRMSKDNSSQLPVRKIVHFETRKFEELIPSRQPGFMIMNPPYDNRLQKWDIINFYKMIGDRFKSNFQDYTAWIFSGQIEALKSVGLRTSQKIPLMNGPIQCSFRKYEMYAGSKKDKSISI